MPFVSPERSIDFMPGQIWPDARRGSGWGACALRVQVGHAPLAPAITRSACPASERQVSESPVTGTESGLPGARASAFRVRVIMPVPVTVARTRIMIMPVMPAAALPQCGSEPEPVVAVTSSWSKQVAPQRAGLCKAAEAAAAVPLLTAERPSR